MSPKNKLVEWTRNRHGNVAMMFALASPVMIMGAGVAIDYGLFTREKARIAMIADEAALAAVSNSAMYSSTSTAQQTATNIFTAQSSQVPQVSIDPKTGVNVSVTTDATTLTRKATVTYGGTYNTIFSGMLGVSTLSLSGTSTAQTQASANINFYVLLDNQGSMALPDSAAGITQMEGLTPTQNAGGCAFACHEASPMNPAAPWGLDTMGNSCTNGATPPVYTTPTLSNGRTPNQYCDTSKGLSQVDNYTMARNAGIRLRFDDVQSAISALMTTATNMQNNANPAPTYQMAVYSVDSPYTEGLYNVMPLTSNYASSWSSNSSKLQLYTVYSDGTACVTTGGCNSGVSTGTQGWGGSISYKDVGFFSSPMGTEMSTLASTIPKSGTGFNGDTPVNVLLIVTDGVEDTVIGTSLSITTWDATAQSACTTLKNNNVKVAILYTQYFPTPGFWLYDNYVGTFINNVAPTLKNCASPGLFIQEANDANIPNDLAQLFTIAAASPRLTQ